MSLLHTTLSLALLTCTISCYQFDVEEATIDDIQAAFSAGTLTSRQLVERYIQRFEALNPILHAITELNPDALNQADQADHERRVRARKSKVSSLHGIPVLLKDNIATKDLLNTTAGSLALLGSIARRDAGVVTRLRRAGAVIFGKASMSEWAQFRSYDAPNGWSARSGQGRNPYVLSADPCGSSSGSAIGVAANMVSVSLGTETDGSIICPSAANSAVGIKPTVGLTSRAGVIPISPRQDTIGPICRTVSDAVHVLEAVVGFDNRDAEATGAASKFVPGGGYLQFLKLDGLKGKRIGILRKNFFDQFPNGSIKGKIFEEHFRTMRLNGAILVDNLQIKSTLDYAQSGELIALLAEFKMSLNTYLSNLIYSPVRSLIDVITFNNNHALQEKMAEYGQQVFLDAQNTSGLGPNERNAIAKMARLSKEGLETLMTVQKLDAVATPGSSLASVLAIGGYPGISVPAGYDEEGKPTGICFGGLKGSEPKLIEIAYAFEQATKVRKLPAFK